MTEVFDENTLSFPRQGWRSVSKRLQPHAVDGMIAEAPESAKTTPMRPIHAVIPHRFLLPSAATSLHPQRGGGEAAGLAHKYLEEYREYESTRTSRRLRLRSQDTKTQPGPDERGQCQPVCHTG